MFVDIAPNSVYLTILEKFDLNTKCAFTGRTPHLRKGTGNVYKFDFSDRTIKTTIKKEKTVVIDEATTIRELRDFLNTLIT